MLSLLTALIERAQFHLNESIYHKNALQFNGATGDRSFLEYFLWETEKVHGKGRFIDQTVTHFPLLMTEKNLILR